MCVQQKLELQRDIYIMCAKRTSESTRSRVRLASVPWVAKYRVRCLVRENDHADSLSARIVETSTKFQFLLEDFIILVCLALFPHANESSSYHHLHAEL